MSLVPSGSSSGSRFEQQGTVDWVSLSKETVGFSVQILSQLARGGVHPYTLVIGQHIGNSFSFSAVGRRNFTKALQELKYFKGFDDIIRFGFGIECLPRLLSTTEQGTLCAALCSALSEFYHEDVAAEILFEMAKLTQLPEEFNPSMLEWRSLLRVFQGVLSATHFSLIVEQFRQLLLTGVCKNLSHTHPRVYIHQRATAKSMAVVLRAIGDTSRDQHTCVRITGAQADLAWIGGVSTWLLGLRTTITVVNDSGHQLVYTNCTEFEAQCSLVFLNTQNQSHGQLEQVQTFRLTSEENLFRKDDPTLLTTGRVEWEKCLSFTFGTDFQNLIEIAKEAGTVLGLVSRLLEHSYLHGVALEHISAYYKSRRALTSVLVELFPELSPLREHMDRAASMSYEKAQSEFASSWRSVRSACHCNTCGTRFLSFSGRYCLPTLLTTIVSLGRVLSYTHIAPNLYPTIVGLQCIYQQNTWKVRDARIHENIDHVCRAVFDRPENSTQLLSLLFSGRTVLTPYEHAAVAYSGICVYIHTLQELPDTEIIGPKFYVVPGRIECKKHHYDYILSHLGQGAIIPTEAPTDTCWDLSLLVTPIMNALTAVYRARTGDLVFDFGADDLVGRLEKLVYTPQCRQMACAKVRKIELVDTSSTNPDAACDKIEEDHEDRHEDRNQHESEDVVEDENISEGEVIDHDDVDEGDWEDVDDDDAISQENQAGVQHVQDIIQAARIGSRPFYVDLMLLRYDAGIDRIIRKRDCCWDCCLIFALDQFGAHYGTRILHEGALTIFPTPPDETNVKLLVTR